MPKIVELLDLYHHYPIICDALASDFDQAALVDFDEQESAWFMANVNLMISRLKNDDSLASGRSKATPAGSAPLHAGRSLQRRRRRRA